VSKPSPALTELSSGDCGPDHHRRAALWTAHSRRSEARSPAGGGVRRSRPRQGWVGATGIGEIAKLPNAHKGTWQHMLNEVS